MKFVKYIGLGILALSMAGCASYQNKVARNGGFFGTYNGDWIVIQYSGNAITDVWKLKDRMVQSEEHSDGWLFQDDDGHAVTTGGTTTAIRMSENDAAWSKYHEYHMTLNGGTYFHPDNQ